MTGPHPPAASRGARDVLAALDVDVVSALVRHVAATVVTPRFRDLHDAEVREKAPGDVVTVVDTEAEAALTAGLADIAPGVPVVGEEAVAADPSRLEILRTEPWAWVVDPLDGTQAFVDGSPDHAVMVGLVERGEPVAGWICLPAHDRMLVGVRGSGAWLDGRRLPAIADLDPADVADDDGGAPTGGLAVWGLEQDVADRIGDAPEVADTTHGRLWSGFEYSRLVTGRRDFLLYWRTWPWDHVPGAVMLREVGGVSRRLDGSEYRADVTEGALLAASGEATWRRVAAAAAGGPDGGAVARR